MLSHPAALLLPVQGKNQRLEGGELFLANSPPALKALGLIIEEIRLTLEVMDKASQKKNDDNKKD